ncbi:MAG: diguanylate cyclase [Candidatus Omnitrophota bacterium]
MKKIIFPLSCIIIFLLGILDYATGYEMSFSIFYLLPILSVTWFNKRPYAIAAALLSVAVWLSADMTSGHQYTSFIIPLWNMLMRLLVFLSIIFLVYRLKRQLEIEKQLSRTDILTGLSNGRYFSEQAKIELSRSIRFSRPISIAYMDIDNFKKVNDAFGHDRGDSLLALTGNSIREKIREYDIAGRLGGDEFAILLPETNSQQAEAVIKRVQQGFNDSIKKDIDFISFSIGLITYNKPTQSIQEMIKTADNLMYTAKNSGKNKVVHKEA